MQGEGLNPKGYDDASRLAHARSGCTNETPAGIDGVGHDLIGFGVDERECGGGSKPVSGRASTVSMAVGFHTMICEVAGSRK